MAKARPPVVYHYCSISGFHGILKNRSFWLSQLSSMNDYMEHTWLKHLAVNEIAQRHAPIASLIMPAEKVKEAKFYSALRGQLATVQYVDPYCTCFSEDGDVLSQWRGYADDGKGFAIGFSTAQMKMPVGNGTTYFDKVEYEEDTHKRLINERLDYYWKIAMAESSDDFGEMAADFHRDIMTPAALCKNPSFKEEQEWRLVVEPVLVDDPDVNSPRLVTPAPKTGFRIRGAEYVHHLEMPFDHVFDTEKPVAKIILGPKNPMVERNRALRLFLEEVGYGHLVEKLSMSKATYR